MCDSRELGTSKSLTKLTVFRFICLSLSGAHEVQRPDWEPQEPEGSKYFSGANEFCKN